MKLPFNLRLSHLAVVGLLAATTAIVLTTREPARGTTKVQTNHQTAVQSDTTRSTDAGTNNGSTNSDKPTGADQKPTDNKSGTGGTDKTTSPACAALTLATARKILGQQAASAAAGDMSALNTANTSLSTCAYTNGTATRIQVTVRTPNDNLGVSKNATIFGSGRPAKAVNVDGYGQSAFWDPDAHRLNILHNNIWYIVELGNNATQASTETAASQLTVKL